MGTANDSFHPKRRTSSEKWERLLSMHAGETLEPEKMKALVDDLRNYVFEFDLKENELRQALVQLEQHRTELSQLTLKLRATEAELHRAKQDLHQHQAELETAHVLLGDERLRLSALMEALPISVAICDSSGRLVLINEAFRNTWGKPVPETLSIDDYSRYVAWWGDSGRAVKPEEWAASRALRQGKTTIGQLVRIRRFDGIESYVLNSAAPVLDSRGKIVGAAVTTQDVTELKRVEKALFESEQRLRLFIEHAPAAIAMFDGDMRYLSASRRWAGDFGLEGSDLSRLSPAAEDHMSERLKKAYRQGQKGEVVKVEEDRFELPDGSVRWTRWEVRPWFHPSGETGGVVIFAEDISERRRFEEQLHALNEELSQRVETRTRELRETQSRYLHADKLTAIGRLSASIAHELNNPLQGIITILKGLRMDAASTEDREMLDLAISESERMRNLIRNLQEYNRQSRNERVAMDVHAAIRSLLLLCRSNFRQKGITAEVNLCEGLPMIHAVPDQIKQVLLNLLTNAADACSPGGKIQIATRREANAVAVAVGDNCMGIEPEKIGLIFQPFYSTKEGKGSGLGLSVCHSIIKEHQGEIRVESKPGEGSTFTVFLPIQE